MNSVNKNENELSAEDKAKIKIVIDLLKEINSKDLKFKCMDTECVVFENKNDKNAKDIKINISKYFETSKDKEFTPDTPDTPDTSDMHNSSLPSKLSDTSDRHNSSLPSELSDTSDMHKMPKQKGGFTSQNIFQKSKYSDTSSLAQTDMSINSATSSVIFNGRSDKYSDTSALSQLGQVGQVGGMDDLTSDTLVGVSELKQRKSSKSSNTKLDMGIFMKKSQSGGSVDNIKRKMMDIGINSNSSTSSICE